MKNKNAFILVIFGASGDLTTRKLIPALFKLFCQDLLPTNFAILGVSRSPFTDESYRDKEQAALEKTIKDSKEKGLMPIFFSKIHYLSINTSLESDYALLATRLQDITNKLDIPPNYLYYLATPPELYSIIPKCLASQSLQKERSGKFWRRIIIEKPYGKDLKSAMKLDKEIKSVFKETQIYRIDHYLGKETVQNILVFRFANGIFEPLWNHHYIKYVEITAVENMGILTRGGYYDTAGALRDMIQNHLLQIVGLTAMEPPALFYETQFRDEIHKVLKSVRILTPQQVPEYVVRGQYTETKTSQTTILGYRQEDKVNPESRTETFVAMKMFVDNWRWSGVPFFIRTGKGMPTKVSEIIIHFKSTPYPLFKEQCTGTYCNKLVIRILPDEGLLLQFGLKEPGSAFEVKQVSMDFKYDEMTDKTLPESYERLLLDCISGDPMLYAREDTVKASWEIVEPILKAWEDDPNIPLYGYPFGTWGPVESYQLMDKDTTWTNPCKNLTHADSYCLL